MSWRGKDVLHRERFFLARTQRTQIDTSGLDENASAAYLGFAIGAHTIARASIVCLTEASDES